MKNLLGIPIPTFRKEIKSGVNVSATITVPDAIISVISIKDKNGIYYYKNIDFITTINSNTLIFLTDLRGKKLKIKYLC